MRALRSRRLAELKPESMVGLVGSGMGVGNLVVLAAFVLFCLLFGREIYAQLAVGDTNHG